MHAAQRTDQEKKAQDPEDPGEPWLVECGGDGPTDRKAYDAEDHPTCDFETEGCVSFLLSQFGALDDCFGNATRADDLHEIHHDRGESHQAEFAAPQQSGEHDENYK